jgi:hypothetical protein
MCNKLTERIFQTCKFSENIVVWEKCTQRYISSHEKDNSKLKSKEQKLGYIRKFELFEYKVKT